MITNALFAEQVRIKKLPDRDQTRDYQYNQSYPFNVSHYKRLFLFRFHISMIISKRGREHAKVSIEINVLVRLFQA